MVLSSTPQNQVQNPPVKDGLVVDCQTMSLFQTVVFFFFFGVGKISYLAPVSTLVVLNCLQIGMTQRCMLAKKKFLLVNFL
jgi:hypothetical protein